MPSRLHLPSRKLFFLTPGKRCIGILDLTQLSTEQTTKLAECLASVSHRRQLHAEQAQADKNKYAYKPTTQDSFSTVYLALAC